MCLLLATPARADVPCAVQRPDGTYDNDCAVKLARQQGRMSACADDACINCVTRHLDPGPCAQLLAPPSSRAACPSAAGSVTDRLIDCGLKNEDCWRCVQTQAYQEVETRCRGDGKCMLAGNMEIIMGTDAAFRRLARREVRPEPAPRSLEIDLPQSTAADVDAILTDMLSRLESSVPAEWRSLVELYAASLPVPSQNHADLPAPLAFVMKASGADREVTVGPSRRDWAFALAGGLYAQAGLSMPASGLMDLALWSFIRSAQLAKEPDHLANVAFSLNVMRRYQDALTLLAYAERRAPDHPDVHGHLAHALRRLGRDRDADAELALAISKDRKANAAEAGENASSSIYDPPALAPPNDRAVVYFEVAEQHNSAVSRFFNRYHAALDQLFADTLDGFPGEDAGADSPVAVYARRRTQCKAALEQCMAGVAPPVFACPFGEFIVHPACKNSPDRATAALSQKLSRQQQCVCELTQLEQDALDYRLFIRDAVLTVQRFHRTWTPPLQRAVRFWRGEFEFVNDAYRGTAFTLALPENFQLLLESHRATLVDAENEWLPGWRRSLQDNIAQVRRKASECRLEAQSLAEFERDAFQVKPLESLNPPSGNHYSLKLALMQWELFIGQDILATRVQADFGPFGGEFIGGPRGSQMKLSAKWRAAQGDLLIDSKGDWGVGGSVGINFIEQIPRAGERLGQWLKMESKYESTPSLGGTADTEAVHSTEVTIGYSERSTAPPAWVRLSSKARAGDPWPLRGR